MTPSRIEEEKDEDGNVVKKIYYNENGDKYKEEFLVLFDAVCIETRETFFNGNGEKTRTNVYDKDGTLVSYTEYTEHHENGEVKKETEFTPDGEKKSETEYDEKGNVNKNETYDENGKSSERVYEFYESGNIKKITFYENGAAKGYITCSDPPEGWAVDSEFYIYDKKGTPVFLFSDYKYYSPISLYRVISFHIDEYYEENSTLKKFTMTSDRNSYMFYIDPNGKVEKIIYDIIHNDNWSMSAYEYYDDGNCKKITSGFISFLDNNPSFESFNITDTVEYYKNGNWKECINFGIDFFSYYENGERQEFISYYKNGNKKEHRLYYENGESKENIEYYENGQIKRQLEYYDNGHTKEYISYYENGQIESSVKYKENGDAIQGISYYENGQISGQYECYENGKEKESISYYENGQIKLVRRYYENGNYRERIDCFENGTKTIRSFYENGVKASQTDYDENGNIIYRIEYDENGNEIKK